MIEFFEGLQTRPEVCCVVGSGRTVLPKEMNIPLRYIPLEKIKLRNWFHLRRVPKYNKGLFGNSHTISSVVVRQRFLCEYMRGKGK